MELGTRSDWKSLRSVKNVDDNDKGPKSKKYGKTNYNLTILIIRNDGHCFDMRHTRWVSTYIFGHTVCSKLIDVSAWTFSEKMSSFVVDCELRDPEHKVEVYAGGKLSWFVSQFSAES